MIEANWRAHLRMDKLLESGIEPFPRQMLYLNKDTKGKKVTVSDFDELSRNARLWFGNLSTYCMVYSFDQIEKRLYDIIFLDTDKEKVDIFDEDGNPKKLDDRELLEYAFEDARTIGREYKTYTNFTGQGGCGVYIGFPFVELQYPKYAIRRFVSELESRLKLKSLDWSVVGDIQRVSRLPDTVNMKNFRLCFPVDLNWTLDKIIKYSLKCSSNLPVIIPDNKGVCKDLKDYDYPPSEKEVKFDNSDIDVDRYMIEVKGFLEVADKVEDGRHTIMYMGIIPRLVLLGYSDEEILFVCKEFIERSGKEWSGPKYKDYVINDVLPRTRERIEGGKTVKMSLESIFMERPELLKFFKIQESVKV